MISPRTSTRPVVVAVSQATRAFGSSRMIASRMASEIWSHILSGWPSVTDSDVNRYCGGVDDAHRGGSGHPRPWTARGYHESLRRRCGAPRGRGRARSGAATWSLISPVVAQPDHRLALGVDDGGADGRVVDGLLLGLADGAVRVLPDVVRLVVEAGPELVDEREMVRGTRGPGHGAGRAGIGGGLARMRSSRPGRCQRPRRAGGSSSGRVSPCPTSVATMTQNVR